MSRTPETWRALLDDVDPGWRERPDQQAALLDHFDSHASIPWFIHLLSGFGGVLAGTFLIGFFICIFQDAIVGYGVLGALFIAGAALARRALGHRQPSLHGSLTSLSLVGLGLVAFTVAEARLDELAASLVFIVLSGALYIANPDRVHRFFMATLGGQLALYASYVHVGPWAGYVVSLSAALAVVFAFGLERELGRNIHTLRPALYGWLWVLFTSASAGAAGDGIARAIDAALVPSEPIIRGIMAVALLVAVILAARENEERRPILWGAGFAALLGIVSSSGVLAGLLILFLGTWRHNKPLIIMGALCLIGFASHYYYSLRLELWAKALALVGSGVVLLGLRAVLIRQTWMRALIEEPLADEVVS